MGQYIQVDNATCDFCDKFLSIKPVKVNPKKRRKCGRCPDENDDFVIDRNRRNYLFPCINCYDGCMELLTTDRVEDHEKSCEVNQYACPICENGDIIPSYSMKKHFQKFHEDNLLLETAVFKVNLEEPMEAGKWFLYDTRNKLFFINIGYIESSKSYFMSAGCLGNWGEKQVYRRITLHYGGKQVVSGVTSCRPYTEMGPEFVVNETVVAEEKSFVVFVAFLFPEKEDQTVLSIRNAALMYSSTEYPEWLLVQNRNIKIHSSLRGQFSLPKEPPFDHVLILDQSQKLYPHCLLCWQYDYSTCRYTNNYVFFYRFGHSEYSLCSYCKSVYGDSILEEVSRLRMAEQSYKLLSFECIWRNCSEYSHDIDKHNSTCGKQPVRSCPVSFCHFKGILSEISTHFKKNHYPQAMESVAFLEAPLDVNGSQVEMYLLVKNAFVSINLKYVETEWQLKFSLCGDKFTFGGKKLKAAVFERYTKRLLAMCESPEVIKLKPRTIGGFFKFYLE